ncbi:MAG: T9SS type A sorting domain-containing protein [Bacteroidales bacterium]
MEIGLYTDIFENQHHNFEVSQNYPNPVSGITHFTVELQQNTELLVEVSDLSGRIVYTIPEKRLNAGKHLFELDATGFTKGVYFYTVKAGAEKVTKKMVGGSGNLLFNDLPRSKNHCHCLSCRCAFRQATKKCQRCFFYQIDLVKTLLSLT